MKREEKGTNAFKGFKSGSYILGNVIIFYSIIRKNDVDHLFSCVSI